jgi:hypothetical protein
MGDHSALAKDSFDLLLRLLNSLICILADGNKNKIAIHKDLTDLTTVSNMILLFLG